MKMTFMVAFLQSDLNLLKSSGFLTCQQVENSKILHGARFAVSVFYGSKNRQRLSLCTSLTDPLL